MFKTIFPPKELENQVSFFYIMEKEITDLEEQESEFLLPSGTSIMGFHYVGNWYLESVKSEVFAPQELPDFYIAGQQTTSYSLKINALKTGIIGVALKPTALWQWFGIPMQNFTDNVIKTQNIIKDSVLFNDFKNSVSLDDKLKIITCFLIELTQKTEKKPTLVDTALEVIFKNKGCITPKELTKITGLTERSLQIAFRKQVGVSPLQYARIIRFNNLFLEIAKPEKEHDLLFLSSIYNYYDASHLYKDFIKFTGIAPTDFSLEKFKLLEELVADIPYLTQVQK